MALPREAQAGPATLATSPKYPLEGTTAVRLKRARQTGGHSRRGCLNRFCFVINNSKSRAMMSASEFPQYPHGRHQSPGITQDLVPSAPDLR